MEFTCCKCGEEFEVSEETQTLFEEGEIQKPDTCDECLSMLMQSYENTVDVDVEEFLSEQEDKSSDADLGPKFDNE